MSDTQPRFSFGLPVRNGESRIERTIDSLLAQDIDEIEVVICDNDSDDATQAICEGYAARDARVRYFRNPENIGQIENFNRVFELSRAPYFRWIGIEDLLDPAYARVCAAALEADPDAAGATTLWDFYDDAGSRTQSTYSGERLESPSRLRRIHKFFWFQTMDRLDLDPIYSALRSEVVRNTAILQITAGTDAVLALELLMHGHFAHVDELLASRKHPDDPDVETGVEVELYHESLDAEDRIDSGYRYGEFRTVLSEAALSSSERPKAMALAWYYRFREPIYNEYRHIRGRATRFLKRTLATS